MYKEGMVSWKVVESSDTSLNFALFTGCLYGLINEEHEICKNSLWPPKCEFNKSAELLSLLKEQWQEWFDSMVRDRGRQVILKQELYVTGNLFDPPDFSDFPYCELREYCQTSWQPFIEWWHMIGGGKNALSFFEGLGNEKIDQYIKEFERIVNRKVKPFNIYIDLVYTGTSKMIEVNDEYIVMVPIKPIHFDKEWWMKKLQQIG